MRLALSLSMLAACASESRDAGPHHGHISLIDDGMQTPAVGTHAYIQLPDDTQLCTTDAVIDGCRVRHGCNPAYPDTFGAGAIDLSTDPVTRIPAGHQGVMDAANFEPGENITVAAEGGTIDAFTATLVAPAQAIITSRFDSAPIEGDLTLTWTGADTGIIRLSAFAGIDGDFNLLDCDVPAAPGTGVISAAVLGAYGGGLLRLAGFATEAVSVDNWTIEVAVGFDAVWPDGTYAQGLLRVAQ